MPFTICQWHGLSIYSMLLLWTDRPISSRSCRSAYRSPLWSSPGSPSLSRYTSIFFTLPFSNSRGSGISDFVHPFSSSAAWSPSSPHQVSPCTIPDSRVPGCGSTLDTLLISLPESKVSKILMACRGNRRRSRRQLECQVDLLSFATYVPLDRMMLRPIMSCRVAESFE